MTPEHFWELLDRKASSRYGIMVSPSMLEDWVEEDCLSGALATGQARTGGPPWQRSWRDLRRALHICQIKSRAFSELRLLYRDIRVQLWLEGADDIAFSMMRDDLAASFGQKRRSVIRQIRSSFDSRFNQKISGPRAEAFVRQMGQPAPSVLPAGFKYTTPEMIAFISAMRDGELNEISIGGREISFGSAFLSVFDRLGLLRTIGLTPSDVMKFGGVIFAGIAGDPVEIEGSAEDSINQADEAAFFDARAIWQVLPCVLRNIVEVLPIAFPKIAGEMASLREPCIYTADMIAAHPFSVVVFVNILHYCLRTPDKGKLVAELARFIIDQKSRGKLKDIFEDKSQRPETP